MGQVETRGFDDEVARSLGALGASASEPLLDAALDPGAVAAALAGLGDGEALVVRAGAALAPSADAAYAPAPRDPSWVRVERGSRKVKVAPLRLGADGAAEQRELTSVVIETERVPCCDGSSCTVEKTRARVWLTLGGQGKETESRRLLAESTALAADDARSVVGQVASALSDATGAPLEGEAPASPGAPAAESEHPAPLSRARLARYAMRAEGSRVVFRDHASVGPRASAARTVGVSIALVAVAAALWVLFAREVSARGASSVAIVFGSVAAVMSLTAYAFFGVARFAAKYVARSAPVVSLSPGRFVIMPWVSRSGAVDLRPEGRFGAAIPIAELRAVSVVKRERGFAVEVDSDHGPIDAVLTADEEVAGFCADVLRRALAEAGHPDPKASARQRARAKNK